ncbi:MAG: pyridoxal phosphate-dependent aminotransferase, partial [Terriglobia bacterium]
MRYSARLPHDLRPNGMASLLAEKLASGADILDLTESNPTRAGLHYPPGIIQALADPASLTYAPQASGMDAARDAAAA